TAGRRLGPVLAGVGSGCRQPARSGQLPAQHADTAALLDNRTLNYAALKARGTLQTLHPLACDDGSRSPGGAQARPPPGHFCVRPEPGGRRADRRRGLLTARDPGLTRIYLLGKFATLPRWPAAT